MSEDDATLRRDHEALRTAIGRRLVVESVAGAFVIVWFGAAALQAAAHGLLLAAAGASALVVGTLWVLAGLVSRSRALPADGAESTDGPASLLRRRRAELTRQAEALESVRRWYIAPFLPGLLLVMASLWPGSEPQGIAMWGSVLAAISLTLVGLVALNARAAQHLRDQLDALPTS